ncbi:rpir family sialic acid utilization regulator [Liquorilactobacillus aquaticus DSM 21051]|uniref:Rpir family sialic acid utilization regulator n=1 Tax=Liquorilactobacillus aquaticus DSM 21051 TaxID=1423725 RepID=A0A0R2D4N6_9LACO|nr:MurR/RpiR family transcriptional regulator [Liquorilactobacillus aquaticus]KRM95387.1 rpir family sialic acid utilization regulator [Liquorilactobacillus aquaticus DSM 21051]
MLFIDRLQHAENLSDNEQRIAEYIEKNLALVPEMAIQKLAAATYTSHSAIVRFAKKLNYNGYRTMRFAITEAVQQKNAQLHNVDANFPFKPADSPMEIAKNISDLTTNTIQRTFAQLNEKDLEAAATCIRKAQRIFLFAIGDSQIRARSFQNKLIKINKFSIIAEEYADEIWAAANIGKDDLAIFLSYTGNGEKRCKIMQFLSKRHIPTLLLTGNPQSKFIPYVSQSIVIIQTEYDTLKIGTFSSQVSFEYLLNTLFAVVYSQSYQHNVARLKTNYVSMIKDGILKDNI